MPRRIPAPTRDVDGGDDAATEATDVNLAVIVGTLSSEPVAHELPSGSRLVRYEVTVRDRSPADSVPVSWLDPSRQPGLVAGDRVVVVGRVRRRLFRIGGATRSATEVVARSVTRPRSTSAATAALAHAAAVVEELGPGERR